MSISERPSRDCTIKGAEEEMKQICLKKDVEGRIRYFLHDILPKQGKISPDY